VIMPEGRGHHSPDSAASDLDHQDPSDLDAAMASSMDRLDSLQREAVLSKIDELSKTLELTDAELVALLVQPRFESAETIEE